MFCFSSSCFFLFISQFCFLFQYQFNSFTSSFPSLFYYHNSPHTHKHSVRYNVAPVHGKRKCIVPASINRKSRERHVAENLSIRAIVGTCVCPNPNVPTNPVRLAVNGPFPIGHNVPKTAAKSINRARCIVSR